MCKVLSSCVGHVFYSTIGILNRIGRCQQPPARSKCRSKSPEVSSGWTCGLGSVPDPWGVTDALAVLWAAELKEGPPGPDRAAPIL